MNNKKFKIAIIGGGAAGFFAAANLSEGIDGIEINIFEAGKRVLEKVRISGGGRCNVTHSPMEAKSLIQYYPRGRKELLGPFNRFACQDTINWFEARGVQLKPESDGRVFPTTNDSGTIIECLSSCLRKPNVVLHLSTKVNGIIKNADLGYDIKTSKGDFENFDYVIVATGSQPMGFKILEILKFPITALLPSLFTFHISEEWPKKLMGLTVENVKIKIDSTKISSEGALLFTHWGLSGPAVLKMSSYSAKELYDLNYNTLISINWLPTMSEQGIIELIEKSILENPKKLSRNTVVFPLSGRLWWSLLNLVNLEEKTWSEFSKKDKNKLVSLLIHTQLHMTGKSTFKEEFVTCGGVELKAVDLKAYESKTCPNLYLAGEVLNIDAVTGGYNFQAAWTAGWHAAHSIIDKVKNAEP